MRKSLRRVLSFSGFLAFGMPLALLGGCGNIDVHHRESGMLAPGLTLVGPSSQPIVRNEDGTICYGPPPDASIDEQAGGAVKWFSFGDNNDELPLGGRNPNVLITRDLLFQSCLAESRLKLNNEQRIKLFYKTLAIVQSINGKSLDGNAVTTNADSGSQTIPQGVVPSTLGKSSGSASSWGGGGGSSDGGTSGGGDSSW